MIERSLQDGGEAFAAVVVEPAEPDRLVLFAVGAGGRPERHLPLLEALAEHGCTVVAPRSERLATPTPSVGDLQLRARRLTLAIDAAARPGLPVAAIGHSIGATVLLALAGGTARTRDGRAVGIRPDPRLERLVLLAPATDFFAAPGALEAIRVPLFVWAGSRDTITPPAQAERLKRALEGRAPVTLRVVEDAGHFSFMNEPPPGTTETLSDRKGFLDALAAEVRRCVAG